MVVSLSVVSIIPSFIDFAPVFDTSFREIVIEITGAFKWFIEGIAEVIRHIFYEFLA
jgi:hypothetical protein